MEMNKMSMIEVINESKYYQMGDNKIVANDAMNFSVDEGELTVILGPSGAGKSTVLNILGGMDSPSDGEIRIDGQDIFKYSEYQLTELCRSDDWLLF